MGAKIPSCKEKRLVAILGKKHGSRFKLKKKLDNQVRNNFYK